MKLLTNKRIVQIGGNTRGVSIPKEFCKDINMIHIIILDDKELIKVSKIWGAL